MYTMYMYVRTCISICTCTCIILLLCMYIVHCVYVIYPGHQRTCTCVCQTSHCCKAKVRQSCLMWSSFSRAVEESQGVPIPHKQERATTSHPPTLTNALSIILPWSTCIFLSDIHVYLTQHMRIILTAGFILCHICNNLFVYIIL